MIRQNTKQRLDRALAIAGIGSRKEVRALIRSGSVVVGGRVVRDPASHVDADDGSITVNGQPVSPRLPTFMLNKPAGVVTAVSDRAHRTVLDLFPVPLSRRLFPAGRLDKDTEGLLIVTGDGDLCHRLISPRHGVEKEYLAHVSGELTQELAVRFARGMRLKDGTVTRPARLEIVRPGPVGIARVTITEGKYHQIKRMFGACGLAVTALKRLRIGALHLDESLAPGAYRELGANEIDRLFTDLQPVRES